jgi:thiol-disulfide isomerase/thioredoxin
MRSFLVRAVVVVFLLVAGAYLFGGFDALAAGSNLVGKEAPEISAAGWINSEGPVTLAGLKGKPVVVEFWATWCPPCRKSIPHLIELYAKHKDAGLVILGLSKEPKEKVEPFAKEKGMTYIVGYGSESGEAYGVTGIPTAYVVGPDGKVAWNGHPMQPDFEKAIEAAIAAAKK